jgi:hypothetical protein
MQADKLIDKEIMRCSSAALNATISATRDGQPPEGSACRRRGRVDRRGDPQACADVLARINDQNSQRLDQLLSWNWKTTAAKLAA